MPHSAQDRPALGVVIVTYDCADVILACLETLLASTGVRLRVAVVDNASRDGTAGLVRRWADGACEAPPDDVPFGMRRPAGPVALAADFDGAGEGHAVALVETGANLGFAGGVNRGLEMLSRRPEIDRFWILNPDTLVPRDTARLFATHDAGAFSLMGGRVLYADRPEMIQIDGGTVNWRTGVTGNANLFAMAAGTPLPEASRTDFVTGASMVASRRFYESVGPMREDYFLYYEEVDWAMRRGDLPLAICPGAVVHHRAGASIGSAGLGRPASEFSLYFKHRARMMFLRRFRPASVATGLAWSLAKAAQFLGKGWRGEARALLAGAFGRRPPPSLRGRVPPHVLTDISSRH